MAESRSRHRIELKIDEKDLAAAEKRVRHSVEAVERQLNVPVKAFYKKLHMSAAKEGPQFLQAITRAFRELKLNLGSMIHLDPQRVRTLMTEVRSETEQTMKQVGVKVPFEGVEALAASYRHILKAARGQLRAQVAEYDKFRAGGAEQADGARIITSGRVTTKAIKEEYRKRRGYAEQDILVGGKHTGMRLSKRDATREWSVLDPAGNVLKELGKAGKQARAEARAFTEELMRAGKVAEHVKRIVHKVQPPKRLAGQQWQPDAATEAKVAEYVARRRKEIAEEVRARREQERQERKRSREKATE